MNTKMNAKTMTVGFALAGAALFAGLIGSAGAAALPDGYTEIEYIESTEAGQQYVNTGFFPTSNTVLTVDAQLTVLPSVRNATTAIFGTLQFPSGPITFKCYTSPHDTGKPTVNVNRYRTQLGEQDGWNVTKAVANLTRTKYTMNAPQKYLIIQDMQDGLVYSKDFTSTNIAPSSVAKSSLDLMALCDTKTHGKNPGPMRLYAAAITEGGVAARDFVPCKNSAGVAGLYDTVGAKFYPSSRSDQAFVAGPALMTDTVNAAARSASLTFPASSDARELYLVGASFDSAALATNWTYEAKLADVPANAASLDAVAFPAAFFRAGCKRYRFQIRSTAGAVEATTTTGLSNMRDETGRFNVYSDATALYFGAEDKNGNGFFDAGDWTDVRHAANADSATHTVSRYRGEATNLVVRSVDVFSPTMNKTLANQSCVFMQQGVSTWTEGDNTIRKIFPASMNLQKPIVGDTYTFLCRFRPGPHQTVKYNRGDSWLANLGCRWNVMGAYFGFTGLTESGDPANAYAIRYSNGDSTYCTADALVVSNMFWHEVAFVVSGQYARVELANAAIGAGQQHDLFKIYEKANSFPTNKCLTSAPGYYYANGAYCQVLGDGSTKAATVRTNSTYLTKDFRGDIHLAAIWNRALSHDEIIEAFSDAQPSQWRVGMTGCSADVLNNGTTTADVTAGTDPSEWRKIPRALVAGQKLTLNFKIEPTQANMQQVVRLVPACAANARVRFTLDGASLGEVALTDASPALAFMPRGAMTAGDHALVVERVDDGSDALLVDTLEMCGSWQIGEANQSCGFGLYSVGNLDRVVMPMAPKNYPGTTYGSRVIKLRFYIPSDVLSKARFRYVTNHPYEASKIDNTQVYTLNGTKIGEERLLRQDVTLNLPEELLCAGENVLEIKMKDVSDGKTHWLQFDFHRLEMRLKTGVILILR